MHPTRREMIRLGLGSSALLACGPTVPLFLARSAGAVAEGGDPVHTVDFRRVYANPLDRWLGVPHRDVLGAGFKPICAGVTPGTRPAPAAVDPPLSRRRTACALGRRISPAGGEFRPDPLDARPPGLG